MSLEDEIKKLTQEIIKLNNTLQKNKSVIKEKKFDGYMTIKEFCEKLNISKALFYKRINKMDGFNVTKIGSRSLISFNQYNNLLHKLNYEVE